MGIAGPLRAKMVSLESMGGNYQDVRHRVPDLSEGQAPARLRAAGVARGGPRADARLASRAARGPRGCRSRVSRAPATSLAGAGGESPRPLLHVVDRSDAALMSIGTLASGVLAYAFNVLAARTLGPAAYGAVGALWGAMFLLAVLLFRPIEQTVSRAIADHVARGEDARPVVRSAAWLTGLVDDRRRHRLALLAWTPITDRLFGGERGADGGAGRRPRRLRAVVLRARARRRRPVVRRLRPRAPVRRRDPLRARPSSS